MKITFRQFEVHKRVPLSISRGTQSSSSGLEIRILYEGMEGLGEACAFSIPGTEQSLEDLTRDLDLASSMLRSHTPWNRLDVEALLRERGICSAVIASIDMALHDWIGKMVHQPVWRLLGCQPVPSAPLSVTIGIATPEAAQQRLIQWLELGVIRAVKIKMGGHGGIQEDQSRFEAVAKLLPSSVRIGVDANGGWSIQDAQTMSHWLAERGVDHIEQPTDPIDIAALRAVHEVSPIPILADESCRTSKDIPRMLGACRGINIKLPKCGGLTEACRMIACARMHDLSLMLGCYSQTSLANTASLQIASLVDYVDLDSHLNLIDDPFVGGRFDDGFLRNRELPGLGVTHA